MRRFECLSELLLTQLLLCCEKLIGERRVVRKRTPMVGKLTSGRLLRGARRVSHKACRRRSWLRRRWLNHRVDGTLPKGADLILKLSETLFGRIVRTLQLRFVVALVEFLVDFAFDVVNSTVERLDLPFQWRRLNTTNFPDAGDESILAFVCVSEFGKSPSGYVAADAD